MSLPAGLATPSRSGPVGAETGLHLFVAALCFGLVALAFLFQPAVGEGGLLTVGGTPLPEVCHFKAVTGIPCPGCGLTRSWVAAVRGDVADSVLHHPLGWLVLLYVLAQGARHLTWIATPSRGAFRRTIEVPGRWLDRGAFVLAGLLLVAWVPTLIGALGE